MTETGSCEQSAVLCHLSGARHINPAAQKGRERFCARSEEEECDRQPALPPPEGRAGELGSAQPKQMGFIDCQRGSAIDSQSSGTHGLTQQRQGLG